MLRSVRLSGSVRRVIMLRSSASREVAAQEGCAPFYVVVRGTCIVQLAAERDQTQTQVLRAGDAILLPHGDAHVVRDDGSGTRLVAGEFRFDSPMASSILAAMDPVVCVAVQEGQGAETLQPVMRLLCQEQNSGLPGSAAATAELLKLLFIHLLRSDMDRRRSERHDCRGNSFALMFEPSLRGAAEALHRSPERPWTVESLAHQAGMTRTSFAVKFAQTTGIAPFAYLRRLRMMRAIDLLHGTRATLEDIAERVGYGSEAAFATAFKREIGTAPGAYRRGAREAHRKSRVRARKPVAALRGPRR